MSVSALCAVFELGREDLLADAGRAGVDGSNNGRIALLVGASAIVGAGVGAMLPWLLMNLGGG